MKSRKEIEAIEDGATIYASKVVLPPGLGIHQREAIGHHISTAWLDGREYGYEQGRADALEEAAEIAGIWEDDNGTVMDIGADIRALAKSEGDR